MLYNTDAVKFCTRGRPLDPERPLVQGQRSHPYACVLQKSLRKTTKPGNPAVGLVFHCRRATCVLRRF
jgi:hypothetical protein